MNQFVFAPLLADIGDIIAAAAAILIPLSYIIRAIMNSQKKEGQPPVARPAHKRVAPQPPQGQQGEQKKLTDEVEEFLRRAAERRRGGQPREVEVLRPEPPAKRKPLAQSQPQVRSPRPVEALVVTDEERLGREAIARHVEQHLDTRSYLERAAQLTKVDNADEQIQAHLHSVFDHQIGNLGQPTQTATADDEASKSTTAAQSVPNVSFAEMLASPQSLRHAFILQEILKPPDDRW